MWWQSGVLARRNAFQLLEHAVEVGDIVEACLITDFCDGAFLLLQQSAGKFDAVFVEVHFV